MIRSLLLAPPRRGGALPGSPRPHPCRSREVGRPGPGVPRTSPGPMVTGVGGRFVLFSVRERGSGTHCLKKFLHTPNRRMREQTPSVLTSSGKNACSQTASMLPGVWHIRRGISRGRPAPGAEAKEVRRRMGWCSSPASLRRPGGLPVHCRGVRSAGVRRVGVGSRSGCSLAVRIEGESTTSAATAAEPTRRGFGWNPPCSSIPARGLLN